MAAEGWSRRPWSSPFSTPLRNKWWSTPPAGRCSVGTETAARRPPLKASTHVPVTTSGSPLPSHLTSSGDPYGRCSAVRRGCATTTIRLTAGRRVAHDAIDRELSSWTRQHRVERIVQMFLDAGIPSATVIPPRDIAANPQLRHRRLFEVEHHPVTGEPRGPDPAVPLLARRPLAAVTRADAWSRQRLGSRRARLLTRRDTALARGGPRWCSAHGHMTPPSKVAPRADRSP